MKASDFVEEFLHAQGVSCAFEVVGGMITHLIDSIHRCGRIRLVSMRHEQAAAFAADCTGRLSDAPGVAMATSGPGATNLLTGIASCYFDSVPAVFITGQVNRREQKGERPIRQLGFQETDIVAMARPITKAALRVGEPEQLPALISEAFRVARENRPGPVLIDIPMDVQGAEIDAAAARLPDPGRRAPEAASVASFLDDLDGAERPMVLAGAGVRSARGGALLRAAAERLGLPVVTSLLAVDLLPSGHPLRVGMIGTYGNRWANTALGHSDLLLVVGSRLDIRQTGADTEAFAAGRRIHHVDCDPGEINNRIGGCEAINADAASFLSALLDGAGDRAHPGREAWLGEIDELRRAWPDTEELAGVSGVNPNALMHALGSASSDAAAFISDVGQHQMWAAQSLQLGDEQRFLTSGGMGAMGYGLPAAIGAAMHFAGRPVVLIAGDGGFQLNLQELQTVAHDNLPLKVVIVNNRCHGMVRQFQESYFEGRYPSTWWGYSAPDFSAVAAAYGIASATISSPAEVEDALGGMWEDPTSPYLLEVAIEPTANVYPKIAFGRPITEMEPLARPVQMEGT